RQADRIIDTLSSGPHERILDPELRFIWKEMGWRGTVKARHFVVALHDHYIERLHSMGNAPHEGQLHNEVASNPEDKYAMAVCDSSKMPPYGYRDRWALEYIGVVRLQPLIEAFDDDASGFISVVEANEFSDPRLRPRSW
ncbi:hypothetical protein GLOTRDRAFT_12189, partial [Gloeophyllum trabeum ATCC 11539]